MDLLCRQDNGPLDGRKIPAQPLIPRLGEAFQVNIGRVDQGQELPPGGLRNGPVCHKHVGHAPLMNQGGTVPDKFEAHQRLIVGVGYPDVSRLGGQLLRGGRRCLDAVLPGHGDLGILAEGAAEVAAETACGENQATGTETPQGLFFNGIQGKAGQLSVVQRDDGPAPADSGPAEAGLALFQAALAETQRTDCFHMCRTTWNRSRV